MRDRKNQYDDAEKYLLKGRDLSSNKIYSNMQLMMLYFKMGKKKNAVEYF